MLPHDYIVWKICLRLNRNDLCPARKIRAGAFFCNKHHFDLDFWLFVSNDKEQHKIKPTVLLFILFPTFKGRAYNIKKAG